MTERPEERYTGVDRGWHGADGVPLGRPEERDFDWSPGGRDTFIDRIIGLEAEVKELREENARLRKRITVMEDARQELLRAESAERRIKQMEEALRELLEAIRDERQPFENWPEPKLENQQAWRGRYNTAMFKARAVLSPSDTEEEA